MIRNCLGRGGIKCSAPLLHRRALRALMTFACSVPIETERDDAHPATNNCEFSSPGPSIKPTLRHCPDRARRIKLGFSEIGETSACKRTSRLAIRLLFLNVEFRKSTENGEAPRTIAAKLDPAVEPSHGEQGSRILQYSITNILRINPFSVTR